MKKNIIFTTILGLLILSPSVFAAQTPSYYFTATCPKTKSVETNGGNITSNIDCDTGALSASFNPAFLIKTNSDDTEQLTLSATSSTQSGSVNSIFNIGTTRYIILTNNTILPPTSAITDIKSGSPTPVNNPNAIAYQINDPATTPGQLSASYSNTNKNWQLSLTHRGQTPTSITIPAGTPLANTYSFDDEAGSYQATITLSFN